MRDASAVKAGRARTMRTCHVAGTSAVGTATGIAEEKHGRTIASAKYGCMCSCS
jgi:hypothetical protein